MEFNEHLHNALFASFRSNVVPPRINVQKKHSHNHLLSIGSLVLYPKRLNSLSNESPVEDTGTRREAKSLNVTLYDSEKRVSDVVVISLDGNRFRQANVVSSLQNESDCGKWYKRPKHRCTHLKRYMDGGTTLDSSADVPINNRRHIAKCSKRGVHVHRISSHRLAFKRHKDSRHGCIREYVRNCRGMIKCTKCTIFTRERFKIRNPRIVSINTLVKLHTPRPINGLILRCELELDDSVLTSEYVMAENSSTLIPFYGSDDLESVEHPEGMDEDCCCTLKESLVCSLHFKRMVCEMRNLLNCLCNGKGDAKYRYMLYYHLQALHFLQSKDIKHCNKHRIPDALISVTFSRSKPKRGYGMGNGKCSCYSLEGVAKSSYDLFSGIERLLRQKRFIRHLRFLSCNLHSAEGHSSPSVDLCHTPYFLNAHSETLHILNIPHGLQCIYGTNDPFISLDSRIFCNKMSDMMIRFSKVLSLRPGDISFMIEPEDFTFLRLLVNTPLYNVRLMDDTHHSEEPNGRYKAINGNISYKSINSLIWRYKHVLSRYSNTLSTFLRFVDYSDASQVESLEVLLESWKMQDVGSLMELISCDFLVPYVRRYILESIKMTFTLENVRMYINQLVLSLLHDIDDCLLTFLFNVTLSSFDFSMDLYWYLRCNSERSTFVNDRNIFGDCLLKYLEFLETASLFKTTKAINLQNNFINILKCVNKRLEDYGVDERRESFHTILNEQYANFQQRGNELEVKSGFPLFTHPNLTLKTLVLNKCSVLKSKRYPMVLYSRVEATCEYQPTIHSQSDHSRRGMPIPSPYNFSFMYKSGDDLRQDQLCQQLITVINSTLERHGIRTGLIPYKIMPISPSDGFIEFIPHSSTVFDIVSDWGSLRSFLESDSSGGVSNEEWSWRLRNFVDSLASLSVISYIFGIRDRHYHNILMTRDGFLIHVDFSYIFGADPTPLVQPPFKLSREFMDLLGGRNGDLYKIFAKKFTFIFCILRSHSSEILNLLYVSLSSELPNLSLKAIVEVEMRFKLDLKRDSVEKFALNIISESANSYSPLILDTWHKISNFFK